MCPVAVTSSGEQAVVFGGRIQNFRNYLLIASVQKDDSGIYKCQAENIKGEQSAQAQLTVISKLFASLYGDDNVDCPFCSVPNISMRCHMLMALGGGFG